MCFALILEGYGNLYSFVNVGSIGVVVNTECGKVKNCLTERVGNNCYSGIARTVGNLNALENVAVCVSRSDYVACGLNDSKSCLVVSKVNLRVILKGSLAVCIGTDYVALGNGNDLCLEVSAFNNREGCNSRVIYSRGSSLLLALLYALIVVLDKFNGNAGNGIACLVNHLYSIGLDNLRCGGCGDRLSGSIALVAAGSAATAAGIACVTAIAGIACVTAIAGIAASAVATVTAVIIVATRSEGEGHGKGEHKHQQKTD